MRTLEVGQDALVIRRRGAGQAELSQSATTLRVGGGSEWFAWELIGFEQTIVQEVGSATDTGHCDAEVGVSYVVEFGDGECGCGDEYAHRHLHDSELAVDCQVHGTRCMWCGRTHEEDGEVSS